MCGINLYNGVVYIFEVMINSMVIDVDDCASGPCLNGGTCTDDINRYTCKCAVGYSGLNCTTSKYTYM